MLEIINLYGFNLGRLKGFLLRWQGVGVKFSPTACLKLEKIMLETWKLVRKYTQICSFRKHTF